MRIDKFMKLDKMISDDIARSKSMSSRSRFLFVCLLMIAVVTINHLTPNRIIQVLSVDYAIVDHILTVSNNRTVVFSFSSTDDDFEHIKYALDPFARGLEIVHDNVKRSLRRQAVSRNMSIFYLTKGRVVLRANLLFFDYRPEFNSRHTVFRVNITSWESIYVAAFLDNTTAMAGFRLSPFQIFYDQVDFGVRYSTS